MSFTTRVPETNKNNFGIIITLTMLTLVTVVFVASILYLKCRRKFSKDNDLRQEEESIDLMQNTGTETPNSVKVPTSLFDKAKNFLLQRKMAVITGVQGSGKTFIAKSLVNGPQKHGMKMDSIWICNLDQLHQTQSGKEEVFIIDGIFFELQLYGNFKETLNTLNQFLCSAKEMYIIITIPSYTWANHCYEFDPKFYKVHVDLGKREERERNLLSYNFSRHNMMYQAKYRRN